MTYQSESMVPHSHNAPLAWQGVEHPLPSFDQAIIFRTDFANIRSDVLRRSHTPASSHRGNVIGHGIRLGEVCQRCLETECQPMNASQAQGQLGGRVLIDWIAVEKPEDRSEIGFGNCFTLLQVVKSDIASINNLIPNAANKLDQPSGFCGACKFGLPQSDPSSEYGSKNRSNRAYSLSPRRPVYTSANNFDWDTHSQHSGTILVWPE